MPKTGQAYNPGTPWFEWAAHRKDGLFLGLIHAADEADAIRQGIGNGWKDFEVTKVSRI